MCQKCGTYTSGYVSQRTIERRQKEQSNQALLALGLALAGSLFNFLGEVIPTDSGSTSTVKPKKETKEVEEDTKEEKIEETPEDAVKRLVKVDAKEEPELFNDLVKKYNSIKEADPNLSDDLVALRLRNYVRGYNNQVTSLKQQAYQSAAVEYVDKNLAKDAKNRDATLNQNVIKILNENYTDNKIGYDKEKVKTNADLQDHFKTLACQYLDSRDTDSNCELSFLEIYSNNLAQHYFKSGDCQNYREALLKAENYVQENKTSLLSQYEDWKNNNLASLSEEASPEELLALNSYIELSKFNSSGDEALDVNELAEMLLAKSAYSDGDKPDYEISAADSYAFETDLVINPDALDSYLKNAHDFMNTKF